MKLELFYMRFCPYCLKVTRFINKYKLGDKIELINISTDKEGEKRLAEIGGKVQVPCLFVDGQPMYESSAIIEFLKTNLL
ncbi:MAG: glutathione S-transferase N-terminal domain-containing protein [Lagierella massiliensis]|nr:glutathione S-transferase N-terminal domain-containing protein [Lagierella massiliensis]